MANSQITKEEIKKIMEVPGKVRGQVFLTDLGYVKEKKGQKGVELLKKKIKEWGIPIDYEKAKPMEWYPAGFRVISLLAIKEIFGWGDKEIFDLGNNAPKYSFIVKILMKYFLSFERSSKESPKYWEKHYTVGKLEFCGINEKEKYAIYRLKGFKIHPVLCPLYAGYFLRIAQYVLKSEKITIKETKCMFKGDPYHEYVIRWK